MTIVKADEVRIPRRARAAVAHHEEVVVLNRERPAFVIVHPEDHRLTVSPRRGRRLREALALLANAAPPDPTADPDAFERWAIQNEANLLLPGALDFPFGALAPAKGEQEKPA